jgi:radical SAM protein with 4Fe4S-binding SPASM domain
LLLDKFLEAINNNPYLIFLVSLDGLEEENDLLRGEGVYRKVVENIKILKSLQKPPYIGIQFTIRPENIKVMYRFCEEMAHLGVDWILLNPCWFISKDQACEYEQFMMDNFNVRPKSHLGYFFPYELDKKEFIKQFQKIKSKEWPIQISCYWKEPQDIHSYLDEPGIPPRNKFCYKQWLRIDITPKGDVTPCAQFPDLVFGNIKDKAVEKIWNSIDYKKFRQLIRERYLPICSKCNAIYLYDAGRKFL